MSRTLLRHPPEKPQVYQGIVTVAPEMKALCERVRRVARSEATVLVRGETGTGKELIARALHAFSPRAERPFRAANCATFTPELLASELFGHVKGAFTGATRDKAGLFALANGGSLFLDEIAELPLDLQARMLRVLQDRRFTPVGSGEELQADVRLISATNTGLRRLVAEGRFREDLMYRVRVVVLFIPRLVERTGDLEALTWHFIDHFNAQGVRRVHAIDGDAWEAMSAYPWPGNVRELRNNIEQAFVLGEGPVLQLDELTPELQERQPAELDPLPAAPTSAPAGPAATLVDLQRAELIAAFQATGGRREAMAARLGISRATLYRRLKTHGLI